MTRSIVRMLKGVAVAGALAGCLVATAAKADTIVELPRARVAIGLEHGPVYGPGYGPIYQPVGWHRRWIHHRGWIEVGHRGWYERGGRW